MQKYEMFRLNLPEIQPNIKHEGKKPLIFDPLRKRYVRLTPEEWVRQHFASFLINHKHYPASLIANEISINLNGMSRRCDTVVFNSSLTPLMIVEYKAPTVAITQKTFMQINAYNQVLRVPYLTITNGLTHYCCHIDYSNIKCDFLPDLPAYQELRLPPSHDNTNGQP